MTIDEATNMLDDIESNDPYLTAWESDFIASIREWVDGGKNLSVKQEEVLRKIHQKSEQDDCFEDPSTFFND